MTAVITALLISLLLTAWWCVPLLWPQWTLRHSPWLEPAGRALCALAPRQGDAGYEPWMDEMLGHLREDRVTVVPGKSTAWLSDLCRRSQACLIESPSVMAAGVPDDFAIQDRPLAQALVAIQRFQGCIIHLTGNAVLISMDRGPGRTTYAWRPSAPIIRLGPDTPAMLATLTHLDATWCSVDFQDHDLKDVLDFIESRLLQRPGQLVLEPMVNPHIPPVTLSAKHLTIRQVLSWCCELTGLHLSINRDGVLHLGSAP